MPARPVPTPRVRPVRPRSRTAADRICRRVATAHRARRPCQPWSAGASCPRGSTRSVSAPPLTWVVAGGRSRAISAVRDGPTGWGVAGASGGWRGAKENASGDSQVVMPNWRRACTRSAAAVSGSAARRIIRTPSALGDVWPCGPRTTDPWPRRHARGVASAAPRRALGGPDPCRQAMLDGPEAYPCIDDAGPVGMRDQRVAVELRDLGNIRRQL